MRNRSFFILSLLALLAWGCSRTLERPGVPIWAGVRLGPELDTLALAAHLDTLRAWGFAGVVLEGTVKATTDSLAIAPGQLAALRAGQRAATRVGLPVGFALSAPHPDSMAGWGPKAARAYGVALTELLNADRARSPKLAVAGLNFGDAAATLDLPSEQPTLLLNAQLPGALAPNPTSDYLTVAAYGALDGDHKAYARQWHTQASALARQSGQPVFLAQTNLLGENRLLQLKNHLRFWPRDVELKGLVLNTIYPTPSVLDSSSQFGLAHERELIAWLRGYLRRP